MTSPKPSPSTPSDSERPRKVLWRPEDLETEEDYEALVRAIRGEDEDQD